MSPYSVTTSATGVETTGLGKHLFAGMPGGPDLLARYPGASILVARENFGCGSSREHAAWAFKDRGFHAVVAPSFARIFLENAYNNGFVLATVPVDVIDRVFASPSARIDVANQTIAAGGDPIQFTLDPLRKEFLLGGGFLRYMAAQIETVRAWEASARG